MSKPERTTALRWLLRMLLAPIALAFSLLWVADRAIGSFLQRSDVRSLIFPAHVEASYTTYEFAFTARINNVGLRGPDLALARGSAQRVLFLGGSYVFAWGVDEDQVWVRRIEQALRARGRDVELVNAGVPGMRPRQYADLADVLIPLLQPDLVVLGLLQGDELRRSEQDASSAPALLEPEAWRAALRRFVPSLFEWLSNDAEGEVAGDRWRFINQPWEGVAERALARFDPAARARFEAIDPALQKAFLDGQLNPFLMGLFARKPERPVHELDAGSEPVQRQIATATRFLERLRQTAERAGARCVGIVLPHANYTSPETLAQLAALGRPSSPAELTTSAPDEALQQACARARLTCLEVTETFRARARAAPLYHPLDTHMNAAGNAVLAELLTPLLERELTR